MGSHRFWRAGWLRDFRNQSGATLHQETFAVREVGFRSEGANHTRAQAGPQKGEWGRAFPGTPPDVAEASLATDLSAGKRRERCSEPAEGGLQPCEGSSRFLHLLRSRHQSDAARILRKMPAPEPALPASKENRRSETSSRILFRSVMCKPG